MTQSPLNNLIIYSNKFESFGESIFKNISDKFSAKIMYIKKQIHTQSQQQK